MYALYDDDGYVIAAVVVGEDAGTNKNLVYAHTGTVESEGYDKASDTWSWSRKVVSADGEEIEIFERGDSLEYLDDMQQNAWYQVKYNADGDVIEVSSYDGQPSTGWSGSAWDVADVEVWDLKTAASGSGNEGDFVDNITLLEDSINEYDNVLYYQHFNTTEPSLIGKTLYVDTANKTGFRVAEDVNIVLQRNTRNTTWNTTFYSGVSRLERVLDDLVDNNGAVAGGYDFYVSAIIGNNGAAQTVVIRDANSDYTNPDWGTPTSDIAKVVLTKTGGVELYDKAGAGLSGAGAEWALFMRGTNQDEFREALSGDDIAAEYTNVTAFVTARKNTSFYLVVDGVESPIITTDPT